MRIYAEGGEVAMNLQLGLRRISAVFWGWWAFVAAAYGFIGVADGGPINDRLLIGFGIFVCLGLLFLAHKITCWVIAGFFSLR